MKYKILVAGNNSSVINDLFTYPSSSLELITSSMRLQDLNAHVRLVKPDLFLYCLGQESSENSNAIISVRNLLREKKIPTAIVSDTNENELGYGNFSGGSPDLLIRRPITAAIIQKRIVGFLESYTPESAIDPLAGLDASGTDSASAFSDTENLLSMIDQAISSLEQPQAVPKRILIIDDDPSMLKTLKGLLEKEFDIATAINGGIARKFLTRNHVDLVLLDYAMPNEDGPMVLKTFRQNPDWADIPVVFLTGINDAEKIQGALSLKPQGYLLKPIDKSKLMDTIHNIIP